MDAADVVLPVDSEVIVAGQQIGARELTDYRRQPPQEGRQRAIEMARNLDRRVAGQRFAPKERVERLARPREVSLQLADERAGDFGRNQPFDAGVTVLRIVAGDPHHAFGFSRSFEMVVALVICSTSVLQWIRRMPMRLSALARAGAKSAVFSTVSAQPPKARVRAAKSGLARSVALIRLG